MGREAPEANAGLDGEETTEFFDQTQTAPVNQNLIESISTIPIKKILTGKMEGIRFLAKD